MLALTLILAALVVFVAVLGGIVSATKSWQMWCFIIAGGLMFILVIVQAVANEYLQKARDAKIDDIRGRYNALADYILKKEQPVIPVTQFVDAKSLTNAELRSRVISLANNMRDFENNFKNEEYQWKPLIGTEDQKNQQRQQQTIIYLQRSNEYRNEFNKRFLGEAISYRDELIRRLNIMPPKRGEIIAFEGFLAGVNPVNEMATYLETLARQLP